MNTYFEIERAKVLKAYPFRTGTGNNGPWAKEIVLVEYEIPAADPTSKPVLCRAAVSMTGDLAVYARDNIREGNPYNGVPDQYIRLKLKPWGNVTEYDRKDGSGKVQMEGNFLHVERVEVVY